MVRLIKHTATCVQLVGRALKRTKADFSVTYEISGYGFCGYWFSVLPITITSDRALGLVEIGRLAVGGANPITEATGAKRGDCAGVVLADRVMASEEISVETVETEQSMDSVVESVEVVHLETLESLRSTRLGGLSPI